MRGVRLPPFSRRTLAYATQQLMGGLHDDIYLLYLHSHDKIDRPAAPEVCRGLHAFPSGLYHQRVTQYTCLDPKSHKEHLFETTLTGDELEKGIRLQLMKNYFAHPELRALRTYYALMSFGSSPQFYVEDTINRTK